MGPKKEPIHCVHSLDHFILPWDSTVCRIVIMFQVLPQLFPCICFSVAMYML